MLEFEICTEENTETFEEESDVSTEIFEEESDVSPMNFNNIAPISVNYPAPLFIEDIYKLKYNETDKFPKCSIYNHTFSHVLIYGRLTFISKTKNNACKYSLDDGTETIMIYYNHVSKANICK